MHEQTAEAPRWVGYLLLAVGTLLFFFGRQIMAAWMQAGIKQREQIVARLPFLRRATATPSAWHAKGVTIYLYLFAGACVFMVLGTGRKGSAVPPA